MSNSFGPWATDIDMSPQTRLSTFWRRRLKRLPGLSCGSPTITRSAILALLVTAIAVGAVPTLQNRVVSAEPGSPAAGSRASAAAPATGQAGLNHTGTAIPGVTSARVPENAERDLRWAVAKERVDRFVLDKNREANRKVPGSVPASELRRLETQHELAETNVEIARAIRNGKTEALPALKLRRAKIKLNVAEAELGKARDANRKAPGAVPASELQQLELARDLAAVDSGRTKHARKTRRPRKRSAVTGTN